MESFYRKRLRPIPDGRQVAREVEILAGLVRQSDLEVVALALERLVTTRRDAIAGREYLAGCQVALRSEIARIAAERQRDERERAIAAERARRESEEEDRRTVAEAEWAVLEREWLALSDTERRSIEDRVRRGHWLAATNEGICRHLCIESMRDRSSIESERGAP